MDVPGTVVEALWLGRRPEDEPRRRNTADRPLNWGTARHTNAGSAPDSKLNRHS